MAHYLRYHVKCRVCKSPITVAFDASADPSWKDKLLPMATCNRCYEHVSMYRHAERLIRRVVVLIAGVLLEKEPDETRVVLIQNSVIAACREYGKAVAFFHGAKDAVDTTELAGVIMSSPQEWWMHMRDYRNEAARQFKTATINPFDKELPPDWKPSEVEEKTYEDADAAFGQRELGETKCRITDSA